MAKNIFIAAVILISLISGVVYAAADTMLISQVLYNPVGTNSGGEAVELYNHGTNSVNLSGWVVATETSPTDATLPENAIICGGCHYLVADANWSNAKGNATLANADYEEAITLANSDAGVALKDSNGTPIDAVGWGNPASIGSGLFEGSPHPGSSIGNSLLRRVIKGSYIDTNNNSNDFVDSTPNFRNSSSVSQAAHNSGDIGILIVVTGSGPIIGSASILTDDDPFLAGSQVSPVPKSNKTVSLEAVVSELNSLAYLSSVVAGFNGTNFSMAKKSDINSTAGIYSASFNLSSSFPPGNYTVAVTAADNSGLASSSSASFEYLTMAAIDMDAASIQFNASPGLTYEVAGDQSSLTTANITLLNAGNVALDFDISSTNFTSGGSAIAASRLQYAFNGNYSNPALAGNMTNQRQRKDVNLNPDLRAGLSLRLNVPLATSPGNYSGKISLVAVYS